MLHPRYQFGFYYQMTEVTKMSPGDEGGASLRQQGFAWGEKALEVS
jgi:hypothetical protein